MLRPNAMNMKQPTIPALLIILLSLFVCSNSYAQSMGEAIVIEVADFNSQKNLDIYSLFENDQELTVINSCDALGWVVLRSNNSALSKAMARSYLSLKMTEVLEVDDYVFVEDKQPMDVLEDCRAEMLRQSEVE